MPNRLHRYYGAGYSHFITTSCYQRLPLLGNPRHRDLFLRVLEQGGWLTIREPDRAGLGTHSIGADEWE